MATFRFSRDPPWALYAPFAAESRISAQYEVCQQAYAVHGQVCVAGVKKVEEFAAWQLAEAFKSEVFALLKASREAMRDRRFPEGFVRFSPRDFCRFLDDALGSLREAEGWIQDGIEFGYFQEDQCRRAFWFGERCFTATLCQKRSQERDCLLYTSDAADE